MRIKPKEALKHPWFKTMKNVIDAEVIKRIKKYKKPTDFMYVI